MIKEASLSNFKHFRKSLGQSNHLQKRQWNEMGLMFNTPVLLGLMVLTPCRIIETNSITPLFNCF